MNFGKLMKNMNFKTLLFTTDFSFFAFQCNVKCATSRCHYFAGSLLPVLYGMRICSAHSPLLSNQGFRSFVVVWTLTAELNNPLWQAANLNTKVNIASFILIFYSIVIYLCVQLFRYLYSIVVWITKPLTLKLIGGLTSTALVSRQLRAQHDTLFL